MVKRKDNKQGSLKGKEILLGVCGGIAETYDIDPTIVRLVIVFLTLVTFVVPLIVTYIIAGFIMPRKP